MQDRPSVCRGTGDAPPPARRVTVVTDEGQRYPGWVILDDVVLVRGLWRADFCPSVRVEHEDRVLAVRELVNSQQPTGRGRSGVALVLEPGSIRVPGEAIPPHSDPGSWHAEFPTLSLRWRG